jgi:ABC-type transport system involved in multi-copper enzyme maturation permease subunit
VTAALAVVGYALRESLRRKMVPVVAVLTALFLALYALGTSKLYSDTQGFAHGAPRGVDAHVLEGATLFGLSLFATLFLGVVLAVFLTLGVVRGEAEQGLLQPLVVRPLGRTTLLLARLGAAALVCVPYVVAVYAIAAAITAHTLHWTPDSLYVPALELAAAVVLVAAVSLLGSTLLSPIANGVAVFMVFGAGLVSGLLGQIGQGINSRTLERIGERSSWFVPFEALYQDALHRIVQSSNGFTRVALSLGPFGGAHQGGDKLYVWPPLFFVLVVGAAALVFARRDL